MKQILAILIIVIALLGYKLNVALETNTKQTASENLDLQAKCSRQADFTFKEGGYGKNNYATYVNHYNSKLNKCFMEISSIELTGLN